MKDGDVEVINGNGICIMEFWQDRLISVSVERDGQFSIAEKKVLTQLFTVPITSRTNVYNMTLSSPKSMFLFLFFLKESFIVAALFTLCFSDRYYCNFSITDSFTEDYNIFSIKTQPGKKNKLLIVILFGIHKHYLWKLGHATVPVPTRNVLCDLNPFLWQLATTPFR